MADPTEKEIRAERARQLLEDPLLQRAFAALEARAINNIASIPSDAPDHVRVDAIALLRAVREIPSMLKNAIYDAQMEQRPKAGIA